MMIGKLDVLHAFSTYSILCLWWHLWWDITPSETEGELCIERLKQYLEPGWVICKHLHYIYYWPHCTRQSIL